jgi:5'-3' exonuclease
MTQRARLLLVDTNVLGIGSLRQYQYRDRNRHGKETGAVHGIADKLSNLVAAHPGYVPIALWDDRCGWREALLPQYKRHRWETPEQMAFHESYLWQVDVARELLQHLGLPQIFCPGFEADDVVGAICRRADPSWQIRLATTDTDWFQALRPNVEWHSVSTGRTITHEDLADPDRVAGGPFPSVEHYIQAKALAGDSSDGIPGVAGVGIKTAARIIREHGSVEVLWARHDEGEQIKGVVLRRAAGPEHRNTYRRNLQLIDWRLAPVLGDDVQVDAGKTDDSRAAHVCSLWGLPESTIRSLSASSEVFAPTIQGVQEILRRRAAESGAVQGTPQNL